MGFNIVKAKRELIWAKVALIGPSGSGKSYSALRMATGMAKKMQKLDGKEHRILVGNTEVARGRYYANEFDYDIVDITSPFSPEKFVEFMAFAKESGYDIVILDSTSPEWDGKGGCLELHQQAGGTYQSWAKVTPRHDRFVEAIADSPMHIIATMRGKDQYEIEKSDSGKVNVKKLGVGAKQREGVEYEFTCTFILDQRTNLAAYQKDNTHLFDAGEGDIILSESHGEKIVDWANSGEGYTPPVRASKEENKDGLKELAKKVIEIANSKKNPKDVLGDKYGTSGAIRAITDIEILKNLESELSKLEDKG